MPIKNRFETVENEKGEVIKATLVKMRVAKNADLTPDIHNPDNQ